MIDKVILAAKGFCMGAADVVPGVSGGTMAFILGIYRQLIDAIRSFDLVWLQHVIKFEIKPALEKPHFAFIIPLVIGLFCALLFFTRVIPLPVLLHTHPEPIYGLFFGLIIGSIVTLSAEIEKFNFGAMFFISIGAISGLFIVTLVPVTTPDTPLFIFLSGMIAITAMILPGISGSFILLVLHKYDTILNAIGHFNFMILVPFGFGVLAGLIVFSRFLGWLLQKYYAATLQIIIGILIGSLWIIWPFQHRTYIEVHEKERLISSTPYLPEMWNENVTYALLMMLFGFVVVFVMYLWGKKFRN